MSTDPSRLASRLKAIALEEGFDLAGTSRPDPSEHGEFLEGWLARGLHGEMEYLARPDAVARRRDLSLTMPEVRSVLVVAHGYDQPDPAGVPDDPARGVIARYARGRDYHRVVQKGLERVHRRFQDEVGQTVPARAYVDTGPILERELARRAGIGWFGKNTMILNPRRGSYFFLGALLLGVELEPDDPFDADHCGSCRACLDACPTGALLGRDESGAPVMDARRCISYLTIEHRGPIPRELRPLMGNRVYGCDICQEVCPFNLKFSEEAAEPGYAARGPGERPVGVEASSPAAPGSETARTGDGLAKEGVPAETSLGRPDAPLGGDASPSDPGGDHSVPSSVHPGTDGPSLTKLLAMALSEEAWESFSRGSAIRRAGRAGFARNVCVALGNWLFSVGHPPEEAVAILGRALLDPEPLVRGHAAWALGQAGSEAARSVLASRLEPERDPWVREELVPALGR
jgi:epoxyqueuosine reductase